MITLLSDYRVLVSITDITDMKRMEAQLQQARKMEAIATLAGGVAHEFNNALMGIMGTIELLSNGFIERREARQAFCGNEGFRLSHVPFNGPVVGLCPGREISTKGSEAG